MCSLPCKIQLGHGSYCPNLLAYLLYFKITILYNFSGFRLSDILIIIILVKDSLKFSIILIYFFFNVSSSVLISLNYM